MAAQMVIVDIGIPPGFEVLTDDLTTLVERKVLQKFELTPRQVICYLDRIDGGATVEWQFRLRAKMPVKAKTGRTTAYEYYAPQGTQHRCPNDVGGEVTGILATAGFCACLSQCRHKLHGGEPPVDACCPANFCWGNFGLKLKLPLRAAGGRNGLDRTADPNSQGLGQTGSLPDGSRNPDPLLASRLRALGKLPALRRNFADRF
jgi:hypothetical protein